ncbi:M56 family metallopeptidase [Winogradskyella ouciana]|uniref:Signal transducer regulating beta-lactamase production, contains metallopeptidase domain n=1 Tax=Winogradskyella ouciana TaxID=2608631 RepID=A0A7K1GD48_9FLAO|nr:M56 family metallopeptidase [Winogradskyella ouciana]MTE26354.1 hypothetical protein [Winogradskyella ouciana]
MLYTIFQIIAFQALFLLVYDLFLKRETFFNYNRAYLLLTAIVSFVLPFLKFPELKKMTTQNVVIQLPEVFIGTKASPISEIQIAETAGKIMEQPKTPIWQYVFWIGLIIATLVFVYKIVKLYWLKENSPKRWQGNILVVRLIKSSAAFSFFNTVFLGEKIPDSEKTTIYKHELVHVEELHTLDLLFFELLRIVFWFNPLIYIYQNRIKELHEFIADAKAVKQNGKAEYYQSLLNQMFDTNNVSFTNTFFKKSLIKKRIAMLQKSKSRQLNLIKYALLIPLVFGMLIYTSTEVRAQEKTETKNEANQELTDEQLIQSYYDEILKMKEEGISVVEISDYTGFTIKNSDVYIRSKENYLKSIAFMQHMADALIKRKSEDGTLTDKDYETAKNMTLNKHQSYKEYREWKKTDEAKKLWESNAKDGELRFVVNDFKNKTAKEQKRFDELLGKLHDDDNFYKLTVCEMVGVSKIELYDNSDEDTKEIEVVEENIEVPFLVIEEVPTLPKCLDLTNNKERKYCLSDFVNKHVNKNFNTDLAHGLPPGRKRVFVQFKIDKEGKVKDIIARGPSEALEVEAKRVIGMLPQFIPGRQKGKLVTVPYSLPIVFEVKDDAKRLNELIQERDNLLQNANADKNPVIIQLNQQINALKTKLKDTLDSFRAKNYDKFIERLETKAQRDSVEFIPSEYKKTKPENETEPWTTVEVAPVHPNCNPISSESDSKECTTSAINKHIGKNFNMNFAKSLNLTAGKKRIFVQFKIDKEGLISNIIARGPHPKLEEEAVRVLKLLPQFTPGKKDGETVDVAYSIPIIFQIVNTKND